MTEKVLTPEEAIAKEIYEMEVEPLVDTLIATAKKYRFDAIVTVHTGQGNVTTNVALKKESMAVPLLFMIAELGSSGKLCKEALMDLLYGLSPEDFKETVDFIIDRIQPEMPNARTMTPVKPFILPKIIPGKKLIH